MSGEERHPEDYCHRCGGPNISWYTPGGIWDPVMRPVPGEPWKWDEIICPTCFVSLAGGGTWALIPLRDDGERWTTADEREQIKAEALREWIAEWPTTPGDGTFLASVARDGLTRAAALAHPSTDPDG